MCIQDFAEKPKGDALEAMKVDTTVLGKICYHACIYSSSVIVDDDASS